MKYQIQILNRSTKKIVSAYNSPDYTEAVFKFRVLKASIKPEFSIRIKRISEIENVGWFLTRNP